MEEKKESEQIGRNDYVNNMQLKQGRVNSWSKLCLCTFNSKAPVQEVRRNSASHFVTAVLTILDRRDEMHGRLAPRARQM